MGHKATEKRLTKIATEIGRKYGYEDVWIHINEFRDPAKLSWSRTYMTLTCEVSTAFVRISDDLAKDIFTAIIRRSKGENVNISNKAKIWLEKKRSAVIPAPFGL